MRTGLRIYDFEFNFLLDIDPAFEEWRVLAAEWIIIQKKSIHKRSVLANFFVAYLHGQQLDKRPAALLDLHSDLPSLWDSLNLSKHREILGRCLHDYISDFIDWVLKEKFIESDAEGRRVLSSQLRNPFPRKKLKQLGKMSDIEFRYLLDHDPRMEDWRALASEWLNLQRQGTNFKREAVAKFLLTYILQYKQERNPSTFLRRDSSKLPFIDVHMATKRGHGKSLVPQSGDIKLNNYVHDFLAWVLIEKLSFEDDAGHRNIPLEFHNPITRMTESGMARTETLKTPLPYRYIKNLREMLVQGTTFREWTWAQQVVGNGTNGGDWFIVDPALINTNDPDCVWRKRKRTPYEHKWFHLPAEIFELWSPVRAMAIFLKLELPLRASQVRMLDSGEADTWRYESGTFRLNNSSLVTGTEKRPAQRGVFHRSSNEAGAGFFINTNKTADINKVEKDKGYIIPWTYEPVLYWLEKLRNWQERYNPITAPMPWRELEVKHLSGTPPHPTILDERGDACFLFRDAAGTGSDRQKPLPKAHLNTVWYQLLLELEKRCADNHEKLDDGSPIRFVDPDRSKKVTHYPLHALRVSLITAYALEGGVPFPVISKLIAGHARIIMTLYYTKAGKAHVTEVMQEAERRILENEKVSYKRFLMEKTYQEIEQRFAFVDPDAVQACQQLKSASGFVFEDKGICLVGGSLCDMGGELMKDRITEKIYAPVSGYPQERNCVRCRFFLTGPAFLPGLQARFNEISYEATECSERYIRFEQEVKALEDSRSECEKSDGIFTQGKELERTYQHYEAEAEKANKLLTDLQACVRLISRCVEIANSTDEDGVRLVASGDIADIQYALNETTSAMHQLEVMCENAVIYPEVDASKASLRRSQILDAMMQMNGRPPIFFRLSPDQQFKVGNEVMKLIQARTGSLKGAVEFAECQRMLQELNVLEEITNVIEEQTVSVGFRRVIDTGRTKKLLVKNIEKEGNDES